MTYQPRAWFSEEELPALHDFWRVYESVYDEMQVVALESITDHPVFGPMLKAMPAEVREMQNAESLALLRRAMAGEWIVYEENLRVQGMTYAAMGVGFRDWYDVIRIFARHLMPHMVGMLGKDPNRLTAAMQAMQEFLDRAMSTIGESYIAAKETKVREGEHRLAITLDSIGDAVIATDKSGRVERLNPVAEKLTGWTRDEAQGLMLDEIFHVENEQNGERAHNPVEKVLRDGVSAGLANHTVLVARDGARRPIADSAAPIRGEDGNVQGVVLVFRDMTEEHKAKETEARKAAVVEASLDCIIGMDHEGRITEFNPAAESTFGRSRHDVIGKLLADTLIPPAFRAAHQNGLERYLSSHEGKLLGKRVELTALHADGTEFPVEVAIVRIPGHGPPHFEAFMRDITERKRVAEIEHQSRRVQEANRLKSEFLANMSHELRTPLNAIIGFTELLHDGEVGPVADQQREFLSDILTSGRHLLQLINDVLDLSKVEAGKMEFHPEIVDLKVVVNEVTSILRATAAAKRICIDTSVEDLGRVVLDPARFKQVLYNYLSNALKFTPVEGFVSVRVVNDGRNVRIEVEDTGAGISPRDQERLFAEFQQLDGGASKHHAGTGLGLALTKKLVEAQGGSVGVRSDLNVGSVFHAVLPKESAMRGETMPARDVHKDAPTVLVIEDDPSDRRAIIRCVQEAGYAVEIASTGAHAIAMCRERRFDVITLDLILPDMSGLDVLRSIRADGKNEQSPVVVLTVVTEKATAGFVVNDVLSKPVDGVVLIDALKRAGVANGRIAIVDDDAASRKLMSTTLERLGHIPICYADAASALAAIESQHPAAIILDLLMPGVDGFQFLTMLRQSPSHRNIPVLVWTTKDLSIDELARLRLSAQVIAQKGMGPAHLANALSAYVSRPQAV